MKSTEDRRLGAFDVVRLTLLVGSVVVIALLAWRLAYVLLLAFAAVLFAIVLRTLARLIERHSPAGQRTSLALATLLVGALFVGFVYLMGAQIREQLANLLETLPSAVASLGQRFGVEDLDRQLLDTLEDFWAQTGFVSRFMAYTSATLAALGAAVLVVVTGVFLAARPDSYRRGMLKLVPKQVRPNAAQALENVGHALERWLLGQLISMALIGGITAGGLYLIGVPSALALGLLAGIAEFVPVIGPILSFIPAIVIAAPEGMRMALAVLALYVVVQQVESNVIMPLVQRRVVDLPPVLALFAVLALTLLFGPLGLLLGTPLTVALFVAVKQLYVRDGLHEPTTIPGETDR